MTTKHMRQIVERYLGNLQNGDLDAMKELFLEDSVVDSPLYGVRSAWEFFADLFSVTDRSEIELIDVYRHDERVDQVAAHFRYRWTMVGGERTVFDCVDLFRLKAFKPGQKSWLGLVSSPPEIRIAELKIIYDTANARQKFAKTVGRRKVRSTG